VEGTCLVIAGKSGFAGGQRKCVVLFMLEIRWSRGDDGETLGNTRCYVVRCDARQQAAKSRAAASRTRARDWVVDLGVIKMPYPVTQ
jgi:hypothetical protein